MKIVNFQKYVLKTFFLNNEIKIKISSSNVWKHLPDGGWMGESIDDEAAGTEEANAPAIVGSAGGERTGADVASTA